MKNDTFPNEDDRFRWGKVRLSDANNEAMQEFVHERNQIRSKHQERELGGR